MLRLQSVPRVILQLARSVVCEEPAGEEAAEEETYFLRRGFF